MRRSLSALAPVAALVLAACVPSAGDTTSTSAETTTTIAGSTTTTTPGVDLPVLLRYDLQAGQTIRYEVDLDITMELSTIGDSSALGAEGMPALAKVRLAGTTPFVYVVAETEDPGVFEITITADFSSLEVSGEIDGAPIPAGEVPEFAEMAPIDITLRVDEQGNVIADEGGLGGMFGGDLGDLQGFNGPASGLGNFIGPPFPDQELEVGSTWTKTMDIPMPFVDPATTTIDSEVVGTGTFSGVEVLIIETTTTTSRVEIDLADFLIGLMESFTPDDAGNEDLAELEALREHLRFLMSVDESVTDMTTSFDPVAGMVMAADFSFASTMAMDVNILDETTDEFVEFAMEVNISQVVAYRLVGGDGA